MKSSRCPSKCYTPTKILCTFGTAIFAVFIFASSSFAAPAPKVTICHIPPGNPNNPQTITVGASAVAAHLAHGDSLGECQNRCTESCDDNNRCTDDNCDTLTGLCTHTPITPASCNDGNPCTVDTCEVATGNCLNTPSSTTNGFACDDLNECTTGEACQNGLCRGGTSVPNCCRTAADCDDLACKIESCNASRQCVYTDKVCPPDPSDPKCTIGLCFEDICTFADKDVCTDDLNECTDQFCNPANGNCAIVNNNDPCDDNNACTTTDTCSGGVCVGTPIPNCSGCNSPADCNDGNPCSADGCQDGLCINLPAGSATPCTGTSNGGVCDGNDFCSDYAPFCVDGFRPATTVCRAGVGVCDVPEMCTGGSGTCPDDRFAPTTIPCRNVAGPCDLPESCTGFSNVCPADGFLPAATTCRDPAGQCDLAESCTGGSADCPENDFRPNGSSCNDINLCTQTDTCLGGVCTGSNPVNCDDGAFCTVDSCNPGTGLCGYAPNPECCVTDADCPDMPRSCKSCDNNTCSYFPPKIGQGCT